MQQTLDNPAGANMGLNSGAIVEGTNAATIEVAANILYMVDGQHYTLTAADNIAMTACDTQAAETTCIYLMTVDAAGTVTTTKGREVLSADLAKGADSLQFPTPPADEAVIGFFTIVTAAGYTFTCGTTDLGATGITDTFYNCGMIPAMPRTAA